MYTWEAIQEALDQIEKELPRGIKTEWLAEQVSLSPFYFQKLFKRLVHKSVQEYVKLRRLSRVIEELNQEDRTITEIAYDYHFQALRISPGYLKKLTASRPKNIVKSGRG